MTITLPIFQNIPTIHYAARSSRFNRSLTCTGVHTSAFAGRIGGAGIENLRASFRGLKADATAGVQAATSQLQTLQGALDKALSERTRLTAFVGPQHAKGVARFSNALALNNRRIAELSTVLPKAP